MPSDSRSIDPDQDRIVRFKPRTSAHPPQSAANGIERYLRPRASDETDTTPAAADDYRHRMVTNAVAIGFTLLLTAAGIWIAVKIADLRSAQDCVLMGRRDCARVSVPPS